MRLIHLSLLLLSAVAAQAAVLIQIDVSDAANVTFTATGSFAEIANSDYPTNDGVDLMAFFTGGSEIAAALVPIPIGLERVGGSLTAAGAQDAYNNWTRDNVTKDMNIDLNLYFEVGGSEATAAVPLAASAQKPVGFQLFSTNSAAFTGTGFIDFTTESQYLPQIGASGEIRPGYSDNGLGSSIGRWLVIPEPSTYALLLGAGVLAVAAIARRRRN